MKYRIFPVVMVALLVVLPGCNRTKTNANAASTGVSGVSETGGGGGPLVGEIFHDFGPVVLGLGRTEAQYTFELNNASDEVIRIAEIKTTCGCTLAEISSQIIEPGQSVRVDAKLRLSRRGVRTEQVRLLLEDETVVSLTLRATATQENAIYCASKSVNLRGSDQASILLVSFWEEPAPPPPPVTLVESPAVVEVVFSAWKAVGSDDTENARRFQCYVDFQLLTDDTDDLKPVRISVEPWPTIEIRTDGSPWG